jgi:hypothetical protein
MDRHHLVQCLHRSFRSKAVLFVAQAVAVKVGDEIVCFFDKTDEDLIDNQSLKEEDFIVWNKCDPLPLKDKDDHLEIANKKVLVKRCMFRDQGRDAIGLYLHLNNRRG